MAKILCVWEMGGALGHLANLKVFVDVALKLGHQVTLAVKELHNFKTVFARCPVAVYQAPYLARKSGRATGKTLSYSQLVLQRFENHDELEMLCRAWDSLFDAARPDLVVYDFAPSALVASLYRPWKKWVVGSGFLIPRTDLPYFGVFPDVRNSLENNRILAAQEQLFLQLVNGWMFAKHQKPIEDIRQIILQADHQLLLTLPELDHFGVRQNAEYLGIPASIPGIAPCWPERGRFKVFAYLASFPLMEMFLAELLRHDVSVLVYSRDISAAIKAKFPQITFVDHPVDMDAVNGQADLVVNMAGHQTCAQCYLSGVPQLMIPRRQEQVYLALRLAAQKKGVIMGIDSSGLAERVALAMDMARAGRLPSDPAIQVLMSGQRMVQRIAQLLSVL